MVHNDVESVHEDRVFNHIGQPKGDTMLIQTLLCRAQEKESLPQVQLPWH
jgi:hypothetical protein